MSPKYCSYLYTVQCVFQTYVRRAKDMGDTHFKDHNWKRDVRQQVRRELDRKDYRLGVLVQ